MAIRPSDLTIGAYFYSPCSSGASAASPAKWLCTDVGTRTLAAIRVDRIEVYTCEGTHVLTEDRARAEGWMSGPPYALHEVLLDETELDACYLTAEAAGADA